MNSRPNPTIAAIRVASLSIMIGAGSLPSAKAVVSDEDFNALKQAVEKLTEKVQTLQATHEQDQAKIHKLQLQSNDWLKSTADAKQVVPPAESAPGPFATHAFSIVGDAEVQFAKVAHQHGAFALADFAPIFLFRANDNILFEAGFDFVLQNNAPDSSGYTTTVNLSFATIDYMLNDYVTIMGGDMLLPLGTYSERSAGWLNKIPDSPLPRNILPGNGVGMQLRGAIPVGEKGQHLTYSAFAVNGPGSADGSGMAGQFDPDGNVGITLEGNTANLHGGLGWGGRVAYFYPWKPNYDVEVGFSGMSSSYDNAGNRNFTAAVGDLALHLGPAIEIKGEYVHTWVGTDDMGTIHPDGWWVQAGYKLSGLNLHLAPLNNLELIGRYDTVSDGMGSRTNRGTVGAVYYVTNTLWLEGDYEWTSNHGPNPEPSNSLIFQLSYGF